MRARVAAAVAIWSNFAAAGAPTCKSEIREIAPGGYVELFATMFSSPRGLEVFFQTSKTNTNPQIYLDHQTFSPSGEPIGAPQPAIKWGRRAAQGPDGMYALVNGYGFDVHVTGVIGDQHKPLWDVMLPHREWGYENVVIAWDPMHRVWIVVAETHDAIAGQQGVTHRLLEGRLDAHDGSWIDELAYISPEAVDAQISDIGTPIAWAGDHAAIAWTSGDTLYATELLRNGPNRIEIAKGQRFFRVSIAVTRAGYVLAGQIHAEAACSAAPQCLADHAFVTRRIGDRTEPLRQLSSQGLYGGEITMASDGTRVALAWTQGERGAMATAVRAAVIDERGNASIVYSTKPASWVSAQGIAWTACGVAIVYTTMLNTPDDRMQLAIVPASARPELAH